MPTAIEIHPGWVEAIAQLVERYNKYARRHSMSNCADTLDQLVKLLKNGAGILRVQAAEALSNIRNFNPELFTYRTSSIIDNTLVEAQADGNLTISENSQQSGSYISANCGQYEDYSTSSENEYDHYVESDSDPYDSGEDELEALMSLPIEDLNLKNVKRVEMKEEWNKRKCALGDGELKDYTGSLYQCTCGTLYHVCNRKVH